MPTITVNRDGVVGVLWYDRREHPDNLGWDARFTASLDGGVTFLPSVKVSSRGTDYGPGTPWTALRPTIDRSGPELHLRASLNTFMFLGGDTNGLAADARGVFHAFWVDNHTGTPQVWTASVTVAGSRGDVAPFARADRAAMSPSRADSTFDEGAPVRSARALAADALTDVTDRIAVEVISTSYDRRRNELSVRLRLRNISATTIAGPFVIRAGDVRSELGAASAVGDDPPPVVGVASCWRLDDPSLTPRATSRDRSIRFALEGLRAFRDGNRYRLGLVDTRLVVLAPR
jgi:hypothetical protein